MSVYTASILIFEGDPLAIMSSRTRIGPSSGLFISIMALLGGVLFLTIALGDSDLARGIGLMVLSLNIILMNCLGRKGGQS